MNIFENNKDIIVLGYFKGISKKSGKPFAMLYTSIPYSDNEIGYHGDNIKYGRYNNNIFVPDNIINLLNPSIIGSRIKIDYIPTINGVRINNIIFMDSESEENI